MPDPVIKEIVSAIHVRHIQTSIEMAERFTRESRVGDVADHMDRFQHDVTPVFPDDSVHGLGVPSEPDGNLWRDDLRCMGPHTEIRAAVRALSGTVLIDGRANLLELLDRFRANHTFLLVVGSGGLDGIVTPSDMNKQAGRTHLFMHVSALELALADRLRAADRLEEEVLGILSPTHASQVRSRLRRQQESDQAVDLVATLDFQDVLLAEWQLGAAGLKSVIDMRQIKGISEFRNRIMHSVLNPAGDEPERLDELLERTDLVERLLDVITDSAMTRSSNHREP